MLASFDSADEYDSGASEQRKDVFLRLPDRQ